VEGNDLASLVKERGALAVAAAVDYVTQAAKGLQYAHAEGVSHRDIKPANLVLDKKGTVKLLDMGLARVEDVVGAAGNGLTRSGQVMGTLDYMAPEQALDTHLADARSDIYSLGCTLHYLLVGRAPYGGETVPQKFLAHREEAVPSLRQVRPDVPEILEAVFQKMLAKDPQERQQSMGEVIAALAQCPLPETDKPALAPPHTPPAPETLGLDHYEVSTSSERVGAGALDEFLTRQADRPSPPPLPRKPAKRRLRAAHFQAAVRAIRTRLGKHWKIVLAAVAGVIFLAAVLAIVIRMQTPEGTLVVEINEPNATVKILDQDGKVVIERPAPKGNVTISVDPGKHRLKIEKDGFRVFSREIVIASGEREEIKATLVPTAPRPIPAPPPPPEDGGKPVVFGFSEPSQLKDFKVLTGDWRIEEGSLRAIPKAAEKGNCVLLLNQQFDGDLVVEWQQRMTKDPELSRPADNPAVSAGIELSEEQAGLLANFPGAGVGGLGYGTLAYADGSWGPFAEGRNGVVLFAYYPTSGGGPEGGIESRQVTAGDLIGYDQDQSFRMQLQYPDDKERVTIEGMNWSLENRRVIGLRPRYIVLFCHNCRAQFKNLHIRYRPAGTPPAEPSAPAKSAPPEKPGKDATSPGLPPPRVGPIAGAGGWEVLTSIRRPAQGQYFTGVALHPPYVYALKTQEQDLSYTADLVVYRLCDESGGQTRVEQVAEIANVRSSPWRGLRVVNGTLFCIRGNDLEVYSVADPARPKHLRRVAGSPAGSSQSMVQHRNCVFLVGRGIVSVFDVSKPSSPQHIGHVQPRGYPWNGCGMGDYLYLAEASIYGPEGSRNGVSVYDVSQPANPREVGFYQLDATPYHLFPIGSNRLAVLSESKAWLLHVTDPVHLSTVGASIASFGRSGGLLSARGRQLVITSGSVLGIDKQGLTELGRHLYGGNVAAYPHHGDSQGEYAAIATDESIVILRFKAPGADGTGPQPPSSANPTPACADGSVSLFDGQTLKGWYPIGSGKWTVEDGAIVGRVGAGETELAPVRRSPVSR
jgi:hypothetical protein